MLTTRRWIVRAVAAAALGLAAVAAVYVTADSTNGGGNIWHGSGTGGGHPWHDSATGNGNPWHG